MKMHRALSFFLCVMLMVSVLPMSALAEEAPAVNLIGGGLALPEIEEDIPTVEAPSAAEETLMEAETPAATEPVLDGAASGTCGAEGDNLTWILSDDGVLTISGEGEMADYSDSSGIWAAPWRTYADKITSLVVEEGVTTVGALAFSPLNKLSDVSLPTTLNGIGEGAFSGCSLLSSINIPAGVSVIEAGTFNCCGYLTSIVLPESLTAIGNSAFYSTGLKSISFPDSLETIGDYAFFGCGSLTELTIGAGVTDIGAFAFMNCADMKTLTIGDSVTTIGQEAFETCLSLTEVVLPESVTSVGMAAFSGCYNLVGITVQNADCELYDFQQTIGIAGTTVVYGQTDSTAQAYAEKYGHEFVSIDGPAVIASGTCGTNLIWTLDDEGVLTISGTGAMASYTFPSPAPWDNLADSITAVVIEDGVTSIGNCAFTGCHNLTNISIPESVTKIGNSAFYSCRSLETIDIPTSVTAIGSSAFQGCTKLTEITIPKGVTTISTWVFSGCSKLESVILPDTVTAIWHDAFYNCQSLRSIVLPDSVTSIGAWAFGYCAGLTDITIPKSISAIEDSAFYGCTGLTDVYYGSTQSDWNAITIGESNEYLTGATIHCTDPKSFLTLGNAQRILDFSVGNTTLSDDELTIADVNRDGTIDARDATQILRYVNELSSVLDKRE